MAWQIVMPRSRKSTGLRDEIAELRSLDMGHFGRARACSNALVGLAAASELLSTKAHKPDAPPICVVVRADRATYGIS